MTKKHKILLAVALVLAAAYAFFCWWTAPDPELAKDAAPPAASAPSDDEMLQYVRLTIGYAFRDRMEAEVDETAQKLIVTVWDYDLDARALDSALLELSELNKWRSVTANLADLGAKLQQRLTEEGRDDLTAIIEIVDPYDHDRVFATVARGELVYDIVEATEPGSLISDP